jgi:hypothetical protein
MAGAAAVALWWIQVDASAGRRAGVLAALGLSLALAGWPYRSRGVQALRWDGQAWSTEGPARAAVYGSAHVVVHLDFQFLMLVRLLTLDGPARWLWLEQKRAPAQWPMLRRALYAQPPRPAHVAADGTAADAAIQVTADRATAQPPPPHP